MHTYEKVDTLIQTAHPDDFEGLFAAVVREQEQRDYPATTHVIVLTDGDHGDDFIRRQLCRH